MSLSRNFKSGIMNAFLKFLEWAMGIMPRWFIELFAEVAFPVVCLFIKGLSRICERNLELVYGDSKDQKKYELMAKGCIKSILWAIMDILYYIDRPDKLSKITHVENEGRLKKALDEGKGVIAVSAHFGNFPLMFISLVQKGYKVNVIIRRMRDPNFGKFVYRLCDKWGINMIQTSPRKEFFKESIEALNRNEILFFLLDEIALQEKGIKMNFLNREVIRAVGPVSFFERTSSPVLPMFIAQDEKKHFKIFIEQPMEKDIVGFNAILEKFVYQYPYQWGGWFNKKWAFGAKS